MPLISTRLFASIFALTVLLYGFSSAQASRKIQFRTLCLDHVRSIENVIIASPDPSGGSLKVPLYTDVSPLLEGAFAGNEVSFFFEKPGPDGKPVRELVGKTLLAKSGRQMFVFVPGEEGEGKTAYRVSSYDDDTSSFAMGSVRAINLAPVPVRFVVSGAATPQIPPSKYAQFPHSKNVDDYNMYPVTVEFLSANGQWITGQSVSWKASNRRREIVVTLIDTKFKQPVVRMYNDVPPWLEPSVTPTR